ncbi:[Pyruvate dehydrogenase [acetyl-transferring]]-phosphatase 1, mitochondrial [Lecanosticta acicola]|uniref:[Pyruvate dehydrogenase [acetyl-transferring]]-phosphatase 1, mitochondrial n=1 Tax=Lecanosticta acicola TaxID=111012 RepID=A0AAI8YRC2_9PEZI|nr:[Pyruvate dehydrogenase [acetyl-transferring]]-phosphatase 1, mitochondrial [Lecanosticta acicola]
MATDLLKSHSGYSVTPTAVSHTGQLPSNLPCEDTWCSGQYVHFNDSSKDWCQWALFDGHAGARTSEFLKDAVPGVVGGDLVRAKCMDKPYVPNDMHIFRTIQKAFRFVDDELINHGSRSIESDSAALCDVVATAASAYAGSCALMAIFDPAKSILRVANVGDSRAVLGRWNGSNYVAEPMSTDHTGFNQDEVARLQSEHPGEDVVDPRTGRIHGLAVSRAFGDGRWKWVESITKKAHEKFFGPAPRPNGVIKTPPYLTAEPEIKETRVNEGDHPDFLIMASDGLWDLMSSEDAVTCVQMWLGKNNPIQFLQQKESAQAPSWGTFWKSSEPPVAPPTYYSTLDLLGENDEVYYDENEKCLRWKVSPKHFVVEDDNCGVHLIKNALGGKRRDLFTGVLTVQPPYSRNVRDDITVHVIFFGIDPSKTTKHLRS